MPISFAFRALLYVSSRSLALTVLLACGAGVAAPRSDDVEPPSTIREATVKIAVFEKHERRADDGLIKERPIHKNGHGVCVRWNATTRECLIVTCLHIWERDSSVSCFRGPDHVPAKLVARDEENDLALIQANTIWSVACTEVARGPSDIGARIWHVRYEDHPAHGPLLDTTTLTIQVGATFRKGDSGSGLFDDKGRLVGIVKSRLNKDVGVGIGTQPILALIRKADVNSLTVSLSNVFLACR